MKRTVVNVVLASIFSVVVLSAFATAGELPKEQPKFLTIERESVKAGKAAAHAKHEAGWPAAFEKAKSPDYYLALTSMTGQSEAWYLVPWESHAALAASMKRDAKDEKLGKVLDKLAANDAKYISGVKPIHAMARPDISIGKCPDIGQSRYFEIVIFKVRPGAKALFVNGAKAWGALMQRANPDASYRTYEVMAGMPEPTFIMFHSVHDFAEFDKELSIEEAAWKGATEEEKTALQKGSSEGILEMELNSFRLDPKQSYVPQEVKDKDPEFWKAK